MIRLDQLYDWELGLEILSPHNSGAGQIDIKGGEVQIA
jgi:hypothetical protein